MRHSRHSYNKELFWGLEDRAFRECAQLVPYPDLTSGATHTVPQSNAVSESPEPCWGCLSDPQNCRLQQHLILRFLLSAINWVGPRNRMYIV